MAGWLNDNDGRERIQAFSRAAGVVNGLDVRRAQSIGVERRLVNNAFERIPAAIPARPIRCVARAELTR